MKKFAAVILITVLLCGYSTLFSQTQVHELPFERAGHFIVVKAKINNSEKSYNFIVDTGALTFIDKGLADELGLKQRGMMAKIDSLNLSEVKIKKIFCFTSFDVKQFKKFSIPINGIIGSNLLDRYKVIFDFKESIITLSDDTTSLKPADNGILMTFRSHPINSAPIVKLKAGAKVIDGMIDTGQPYPLVFPLADFTELNKLCLSDTVRSNGIMVKWPMTKPKFNYIARLDSVSFAGRIFPGLLCVFAELPPMLSMPLIGTDFLTQFKMIINYPRHQLMLLSYKADKLTENQFTTGLNVNITNDNKIYVEGIWQNFPADKARIKPGDIVLAFNSNKINPDNLGELQKLLNNDNVKTITLVLQNGNTRREIILTKEMLF